MATGSKTGSCDVIPVCFVVIQSYVSEEVVQPSMILIFKSGGQVIHSNSGDCGCFCDLIVPKWLLCLL